MHTLMRFKTEERGVTYYRKRPCCWWCTILFSVHTGDVIGKCL